MSEVLLNWRYQKRDSGQSTVEEFNVVPWNESNEGQPAIIFGQRDKLTTDGPFLDLLRAFRDQLFKSSHLVVVGYSFRDTHVNNYIKYWFSRTENRKLTIIDPGANEIMLPQEVRRQYRETLMSRSTVFTTSSDTPENNAIKERIMGIKMMKMGAGEGLAALAREEGLL